MCTGIDVPNGLIGVIVAPTDMISFCSQVGIEAQKLHIQIDFVSDPFSQDYGKIRKFTRLS